MANACKICPVECGANRKSGIGYCGQSEKIKIAKYYLHQFEEPPISGTNGSGTVFFCGCSLKCVFCQNYDLSRSKTWRAKMVAGRLDKTKTSSAIEIASLIS